MFRFKSVHIVLMLSFVGTCYTEVLLSSMPEAITKLKTSTDITCQLSDGMIDTESDVILKVDDVERYNIKTSKNDLGCQLNKKQLICLLNNNLEKSFKVDCTLSSASATLYIPYLNMTNYTHTPEQINVGTEFVANCEVDVLTGSDTYDFEVHFYYNKKAIALYHYRVEQSKPTTSFQGSENKTEMDIKNVDPTFVQEKGQFSLKITPKIELTSTFNCDLKYKTLKLESVELKTNHSFIIMPSIILLLINFIFILL